MASRLYELFKKNFVVIAGPCAIENKEQYLTTAGYVKEAGADMLRSMVYKPRTDPKTFQGLAEEDMETAIGLLHEAKKKIGLPLVTEVMEISHIGILNDIVDVFQVGARNVQNFNLLRSLGRTKKPIILKRGFATTIKEWLLAAEYIASNGNKEVVLCERGIRTFSDYTRNTLDLSCVPLLKKVLKVEYPIIVDPSHATGIPELVAPMSKAAKACGADGIIAETHCNPEAALCDGKQALTKEMFFELMGEIK